MRIGFLTAPEWPDLTRDDRLVEPYLALHGIEIVPVIWTEPLPANLDLLLMRSTWGYFRQIEAFRAWLQSLETTGLPLFNPLPILLDNLDKRYLLRLQAAGHAVVPTKLIEAGSASLQTDWSETIVKPVISAAGHGAYRLQAGQELPAELHGRQLLLQPFCPFIQSEGEWSLIFFRRSFSHCVLKRPADGHFLVHEEHGGRTSAAAPPPELLQEAQRVIEAECASCLYARLDYVRTDTGFALMELELLEPALYLAHDPGAPARWSEAIKGCLRRGEC